MKTSTYTPTERKPEIGASKGAESPFVGMVDAEDLRAVIHHRAGEIHQRIRLIRSRLKHTRDQLVFDYICDNTIGRGKPDDLIANSQFIIGKRCRKTGRVIDLGCGLKSINTVRQARKTLIEQGIIFEEKVTNAYGAQSANRYGLVFIGDLLELRQLKQKVKTHQRKQSQHTRRGYQPMTPTIKTPSEFEIQRCETTANNQKNKSDSGYYMHPEHVDYLIESIEKTTGDSHSRGAFAEMALTVDEGRIMELLAILKDRTDIRNKGAWFLVSAKKYQRRHIHKADVPQSRPALQGKQADLIPPAISFKDRLLKERPALAKKLGIPHLLHTQSVHPKSITGL